MIANLLRTLSFLRPSRILGTQLRHRMSHFLRRYLRLFIIIIIPITTAISRHHKVIKEGSLSGKALLLSLVLHYYTIKSLL